MDYYTATELMFSLPYLQSVNRADPFLFANIRIRFRYMYNIQSIVCEFSRWFMLVFSNQLKKWTADLMPVYVSFRCVRIVLIF